MINQLILEVLEHNRLTSEEVFKRVENMCKERRISRSYTFLNIRRQLHKLMISFKIFRNDTLWSLTDSNQNKDRRRYYGLRVGDTVCKYIGDKYYSAFIMHLSPTNNNKCVIFYLCDGSGEWIQTNSTCEEWEIEIKIEDKLL